MRFFKRNWAMKGDYLTLAHIQNELFYAHQRCEEWAKWVRVKHRPFGIQPMFRGYMSKSRQWETDPHIPITINTIAAQEVERTVATLPEKNRTVLRWAYVWPALHINAVCRELKVSREALVLIRDDGLRLINERLSK